MFGKNSVCKNKVLNVFVEEQFRIENGKASNGKTVELKKELSAYILLKKISRSQAEI